MRKELRIGLGIGGVLVAGLVAWMLFPASSDKDHARRPAAAPGPSAEAQPSRTEPAAPAVADGGISREAAPERHTTVDIGPAEGTGGAAAFSGGTGGTASVAEAEPPAPAAGGGWDWSAALDHGAPVPLLARTETPLPAPAPGGSPLAAVARSTVAENAASSGTASAGGARRYTVKAGETYWTIAQAEYGNGAMYPLLVKANPEMPPNRLRPGAIITIPERTSAEGAAAAAAGAAVSSAGGGAAPTAAADIDPDTQYRVQAGDSLYSICRKLYGRVDREKLDRLYELNKEAIGPNRAVLRQNMILRLPEAPAAGRVAGASQ